MRFYYWFYRMFAQDQIVWIEQGRVTLVNFCLHTTTEWGVVHKLCYAVEEGGWSAKA